MSFVWFKRISLFYFFEHAVVRPPLSSESLVECGLRRAKKETLVKNDETNALLDKWQACARALYGTFGIRVTALCGRAGDDSF